VVRGTPYYCMTYILDDITSSFNTSNNR